MVLQTVSSGRVTIHSVSHIQYCDDLNPHPEGLYVPKPPKITKLSLEPHPGFYISHTPTLTYIATDSMKISYNALNGLSKQNMIIGLDFDL